MLIVIALPPVPNKAGKQVNSIGPDARGFSKYFYFCIVFLFLVRLIRGVSHLYWFYLLSCTCDRQKIHFIARDVHKPNWQLNMRHLHWLHYTLEKQSPTAQTAFLFFFFFIMLLTRVPYPFPTFTACTQKIVHAQI